MDQVFNHPWMKSSSPSSSLSSVSSSPSTSAYSSASSLSSNDSYTHYQSQQQRYPAPPKLQFSSAASSRRNHVQKSSNHRPAFLQSPRPATLSNIGRGREGLTTPSSPLVSTSYTSSMQTRSQARLNREKCPVASTPLANSTGGYNQVRSYSPAVNWVGRDANKRNPCQCLSSFSGCGACKGLAGNTGPNCAGTLSPTTAVSSIQVKTRKSQSQQHQNAT